MKNTDKDINNFRLRLLVLIGIGLLIIACIGGLTYHRHLAIIEEQRVTTEEHYSKTIEIMETLCFKLRRIQPHEYPQIDVKDSWGRRISITRTERMLLDLSTKVTLLVSSGSDPLDKSDDVILTLGGAGSLLDATEMDQGGFNISIESPEGSSFTSYS